MAEQVSISSESSSQSETHPVHIKDSAKNKIWVLDTTLRDGEQSLKANLTLSQKLKLAEAIAKLNPDIMELGFPVSSQGDFDAVKAISQHLKNGPVCCALARCRQQDILACGEALRPASKKRIHTFIATSPLHLRHKLSMTLEQAIDQAVRGIGLAKTFTEDVEFSCEDALRTPIDDLCRVVEAAIHAGANTINLPDTVGIALPHDIDKLFRQIMNKVPNIDKARLSAHCHDDLGLATANSLAAIAAGARQIECTVNGLGERAGNAALEEICMAIKTHHNTLNKWTQIHHKEISRVSRDVGQICNMPISATKAIVGSQVFAHSSGIHQDGVLKQQSTYEIISPKDVGAETHTFSITARSGRHVIKHRLSQLGYQEHEYDLEQLYSKVMHLADNKGAVHDTDLEALIYADQQIQLDDRFVLDFVHSQTHQGQVATSTVGLQVNQQLCIEAATGSGPVEAVYNALKRIAYSDINVLDFSLQAQGSGANALGKVDLICRFQHKNYHATGIGQDIVEASTKAYIACLNLIDQQFKIDQHRSNEQTLDPAINQPAPANNQPAPANNQPELQLSEQGAAL